MSRFKPNLIKNIISMLIIVITILIGLFILSNINNQTSNKIMIGGKFNLIDQYGNNYLSQNVKKYKVIYFGYTFCPDICPLDVLKISNFIEENKTLLSKTDFIFITVDPERDDIDQMNNFLSNFDANLIGLTGEPKDVSNVLKNFRIYVKKNKKGALSDTYLVDHSSLIFLLDKNDVYIAHFSPNDFEQNILKYLY